MATKLCKLGLLLALGLCSLCAFGAQVAVLRNGFSIAHERREVRGELTRLYVTADGASYVDIPTADIEHFEQAPANNGLQAPGSGLHASDPGPQASGLHGSPQQSSADLNSLISEASGKYRLDPDLVSSVIKAESGFNVRAVSPKGAQGLMQLMPDTASQLGVQNAFDPHANVDGGSRYLRELLERYKFDLVKALAAYNAGPQRVEQYGGVPPYYETKMYVRRIVLDFNKKKDAQHAASSKGPAAHGAQKTTSRGKAHSTAVSATTVETASK